jgi:hypothetical protein
MIAEVSNPSPASDEPAGITELRPVQIRTNGGTQARAGTDADTVADYAEQMREGAKFPPIIVYFDGQAYWLADGFHRLAAHQRAFASGMVSIRAEVKAGTRRDAVLHAAGANASHGLKRTSADKRRAVAVLLEDEEWSKWSNNEIARRCGVSLDLVNRMRREIPHLNDSLRSERTVERNGSTYPMNTAGIGRQPRAAWELQNDMMALLIRWPEAERQQIAQDWQQQEAAAPFWTEMIQALPKPWQWADVRKALAGLVGHLDRHKGEPVKVEVTAPAAPPDSHKNPSVYSAVYQLRQLGYEVEANHDGGPLRWSINGGEWLKDPLQVWAFLDSVKPGAADHVLPAKPGPAADPPTDSEPGYARIHELEGGVAAWLNKNFESSIRIGVLTNIKERNESGGIHWGFLKQSYAPGRPYRDNDLRQACNNVLEQLRRLAERKAKAADFVPTPCFQINTPLRNAVQTAIHAGPKADAVIQKVFFYSSRPHITTFASYHSGRETYEAYELVDLHSYPTPNAAEGTYSGLPVSYVGHSYRLGNPKTFVYEAPAETEEDIDPWQLLEQKRAALARPGRDELVEWLTSAIPLHSEAAGEFLAAVIALLMAEEAA